MLYLFIKYSAFVFGSERKKYQKRVAHVVKIKLLCTSLGPYFSQTQGLNFGQITENDNHRMIPNQNHTKIIGNNCNLSLKFLQKSKEAKAWCMY